MLPYCTMLHEIFCKSSAVFSVELNHETIQQQKNLANRSSHHTESTSMSGKTHIIYKVKTLKGFHSRYWEYVIISTVWYLNYGQNHVLWGHSDLELWSNCNRVKFESNVKKSPPGIPEILSLEGQKHVLWGHCDLDLWPPMFVPDVMTFSLEVTVILTFDRQTTKIDSADL